MLQAICFIPSRREHVEANLASDGECEAVVGEFSLQGCDKLLTHTRGLVVSFKLVALFDSG